GTSGVIVAALLGDTLIHHAIIFLFFVIIAFVVDAAQIHLRDRAAITALRGLVGGRGKISRAELRQLVNDELVPWSHSRAITMVRYALDETAGHNALSPSSLGLASLHEASRRFVKGLVAFLPLLGFLGTVIGLSIALGELPRGLGQGSTAALDIGASLAG